MNIISDIERIENIAIVSLILVVIGIGAYEFYKINKATGGFLVNNAPGIASSALGVPLIEGAANVIEGVTTNNNYIPDLILNIDRKKANKWLVLLGSDKYNTGFSSFRYKALYENSGSLAKNIEEEPEEYFEKLSEKEKRKFYFTDNGNDYVSPFLVRQHLTDAPFSRYFHGPLGSSAESFKNFVWTDYDEYPNKIKNLPNISKDKNEVDRLRKFYYDDIKLCRAMEDSKTEDYWIVCDRVRNYKKLIEDYQLRKFFEEPSYEEKIQIYNDFVDSLPTFLKNQYKL